MSRIIEGFEKYEKIKKPIQITIYIFIAAVAFATLIGVIFGFKSCSKPDITEAKYFISDNVCVHENFNIKVLSARTVDTIEILNKGDSSKTTLNGKYIELSIELNKIENNDKSHKLDVNDFKLKDHTGLYIPLNTIMSFFNIDAVDMHIDTDENGFIRSDAKFSTKNAIEDYTWVGKEVTEDKVNIVIYFEMKEGYNVEKDVMILEVDFYSGHTKTKKGEDIVLVRCVKG